MSTLSPDAVHAPRYSARGVRLAWAMVDGELAPISRYRDVGKERPRAACPVCEHPVLFVIGTRTAHHFRHSEGSDCPVVRGETADHLNTKFYLADVLQRAALHSARGATLRVLERCAGSPAAEWGCGRARSVAFAVAWDQVLVERRLGTLQPDVLLIRAGAPIAAIEVFHTHAVGEEKALRLEEMQLPWLEVPSGEAIYGGGCPWTIDQPIPCLRAVPGGSWCCGECARVEREAAASRRLAEEEISYRARLQRTAVRVVDFYSPKGGCSRVTIWIGADYDDGVATSVALVQEPRGRIIARASIDGGAEGRARAWKMLQARFEEWKRFRSQWGTHADEASGGEWVREEELANQKSTEAFPQRYRRDGEGWSPIGVGVPMMPKRLRPVPAATKRPAAGIEVLPRLRHAGAASAWADGTLRESARVVDWYGPNARRIRNTLQRYVWPVASGFRGALQWTGVTRPEAQVDRASVELCYSALDDAYSRMTRGEERNGCLLDSPMEWIQGADARAVAVAAFPERLSWDGEGARWVPREDIDRIRWGRVSEPRTRRRG